MKFSSNDERRSKRAYRVTWIGFFGNILLAIFKILMGILSNSNALIADGIHSFSDLISDLAVLAGVKFADKPIDRTHNYGHGKFETLASVLIGVILFFVSVGILWTGVNEIYATIQGKVLRSPKWLALVAIVASLGSKEWLYQYTLRIGRKIQNQALIANAWHHRSDALSSAAVLIGVGGAVLLGDAWAILDPIAAILVSIFIMYVSLKTMIESTNEMLEAALSQEQQRAILNLAAEVPGVINPHNLKTRRIGKNVAIDMHIKVRPDLTIVEAHDIATNVENRLKSSFGNDVFISIHVEPFED